MKTFAPPPPVHEYRVEMVDDRVFIWSACDLDQLFLDLTLKHYTAKHIQLLSEYEAEVERQELMRVMVYEHDRAMEERVPA